MCKAEDLRFEKKRTHHKDLTIPVITSPHTPIDDLAEMLLNLNSVVISAGGAGFTIGRLTDISAFDLLVGLAPNNIRFTYLPARTK